MVAFQEKNGRFRKSWIKKKILRKKNKKKIRGHKTFVAKVKSEKVLQSRDLGPVKKYKEKIWAFSFAPHPASQHPKLVTICRCARLHSPGAGIVFAPAHPSRQAKSPLQHIPPVCTCKKSLKAPR